MITDPLALPRGAQQANNDNRLAESGAISEPAISGHFLTYCPTLDGLKTRVADVRYRLRQLAVRHPGTDIENHCNMLSANLRLLGTSADTPGFRQAFIVERAARLQAALHAAT